PAEVLEPGRERLGCSARLLLCVSCPLGDGPLQLDVAEALFCGQLTEVRDCMQAGLDLRTPAVFREASGNVEHGQVPHDARLDQRGEPLTPDVEGMSCPEFRRVR